MSFINLNVQPRLVIKKIISLYPEYLKDNNLSLRPAYQRDLCWTSEQKSNLIDTIMCCVPMPTFLIYSYNGLEETIDGQHRLTTIKMYIEQTAPSETNLHKPFPWIIVKENNTEYVYYKESPEMKTYIEMLNTKNGKKNKVYRFMTHDEVRKFNRYEICIQSIETELTFEQRKEIFLRWQSGTGITQCERFKNEDYPFCQFIVDQNYQPNVGRELSQFLKSGMNNWVFDLYRMALLFRNQKEIPNTSIISSLQARTEISKPNNFDQKQCKESILKLKNFLKRFASLKQYSKKMKLSTFMTITYIYFKHINEENKEIINDQFMNEFVQSIFSISNYRSNTLNNGPEVTKTLNDLVTIETMFLTKLSQLKKSSEPYKKVKISDALKTSVWNKYIGVFVGMNKCLCCDINEINQRNFHTGHIVSEVNKGATNVENLRPICSKCNLSMGSRHMRDFQKENFPKAKPVA